MAYIVIISFSTWPLFGCAFDLFFATIMQQANPVSLPPVAPPLSRLRLLFKCKCAEMSLMFLNILHCSLAPVVDSGLTAGSSYRYARPPLVLLPLSLATHLLKKNK